MVINLGYKEDARGFQPISSNLLFVINAVWGLTLAWYEDDISDRLISYFDSISVFFWLQQLVVVSRIHCLLIMKKINVYNL